MKNTLYRVKFRSGKLPHGWHDKEYNVIEEELGVCQIGNSNIKKKDLIILTTDFGTNPKLMRKITSLKFYEAIEINSQIESDAILELIKESGKGSYFGGGKFDKPFFIIYSLNEETFSYTFGERLYDLAPLSDFVNLDHSITEPEKESCIRADNRIQEIAKLIQQNPDWSATDLFVHLVANRIL